MIRSLKPGSKDLSLMFIVLDIARPTKTKEGHEVRTVKVADRSGSINLSLWDGLGKLIQTGDIIRMTKGYINVWKNCLTLYLGKSSEFQKVNEFCMVFSELPFISEPNADLQPTNSDKMQFQGGSKSYRSGSSDGGGGPGGGSGVPPSSSGISGGGPRPGATSGSSGTTANFHPVGNGAQANKWSNHGPRSGVPSGAPSKAR